MITLQNFLNTHPSKKPVPLPYEDGQQVRNYLGEEYKLIFDRQNNRLFISLPNSMKREEVK